MHNKKMFYLKNEGQGHRVQHSQWSHSMANINLYKSHISTSLKVILDQFSLGLTVFEIFTFLNSWPWKCRPRSWCTTFAVAPFKSKYLTSDMMAIAMFAFSRVYLIKIATWKVWPWKCRSRSRSTIYENGLIRWQISTSIKVILEHSSLVHNFF